MTQHLTLPFGGYNAAEQARQEFEAAKEHFRVICETRRPLNEGDAKRFKAAHERMTWAGDRYRALL